MIPHGADELKALANEISGSAESATDGGSPLWRFDFTDSHLDLLGTTYRAVLMADLEEELLSLIVEQDSTLAELLNQGARADITRSDATELAAAAALINANEWNVECMHMPNVPKMSRAKSDSGLDILDLRLMQGLSGSQQDLTDDEYLSIASVKHSILDDATPCVSKLKTSLGPTEFSAPYLATQLRVIHGRLLEAGWQPADAGRIFLFVRDFDTRPRIKIHGVAVVDSDVVADARPRLLRVLVACNDWEGAILIGIPHLKTLHERCA